MKVLLSWLREFAPLTAPVADIAAALDDLGTAVESLTTLDFDGIVVARVLETRPHPSADRIQIVDVDAGDGEALQICCGAFNMAAGDLVPLATIGTVMPGGIEIARRKLRGEWSNGMLCSAVEIGLGADREGIMVLPGGLEPGAGLAGALGLDGDAVLELEVNPNRPDALSMLGVARDLAGRFGVPWSVPEPVAPSSGRPVEASAEVGIVDGDLCGRFVAGVVRGVPSGPSPLVVAMRLTLCGMRPITWPVDASNYVMLELGVPNHAYDLALVPDGVLRTRRARDGEQLVTLDGAERRLAAGEGLIVDRDDRPIGIAGVMGGADTELNDATTDVLLEAAWWDPPSITRTTRRLSLHSEAARRFARGTDPEMLRAAVVRYAELLAPGGATLDDGLLDERGALPLPPAVRVRTERVRLVLGSALEADEIAAQLEPIGFACTPAPDGFDVQVPTWRPDSSTEIDVIEEVARHWGYTRLERSVPRSPDAGSLTPVQEARNRVREVLVGLGLDEAMPMPFLAPDDHRVAGLDTVELVTLLNPLVAKESVLRASLMPGLLKAIAYNEGRRNEGVGFFETGTVFRAADRAADLPEERERIAVAMAGQDATAAARAVQLLLHDLGVDGVELVADDALPGMHPTRSARVAAGGIDLGVVGEIDPDVLAGFGVAERVAWFDVDATALWDLPRADRQYRPVSPFPSSDVDLAFVVDDAVSAAAVESTLAGAAADHLADIELFDVYRDDRLGAGRRSLAYRLRLQAPDRTLTDADVAAIRASCIEAAERAHGAELRT
jgi:phenylalanyl-tRNA synthetase beta chain